MVARLALGWDPGTAQCGFGVIAREGARLRCVDGGTIKSDSAKPLEERLYGIWADATAIVREHHPVVMGIEDQLGVAAAARANQNRKLAAARRGGHVADLGYTADTDGVIGVQFILMSVAFSYRVPIKLLQPRTIKVQMLGPGGGSAEKKDIKAAVERVLGLQGVRFSSHAADGFAAAITAERISAIDERRAG